MHIAYIPCILFVHKSCYSLVLSDHLVITDGTWRPWLIYESQQSAEIFFEKEAAKKVKQDSEPCVQHTQPNIWEKFTVVWIGS